MPTSQPWSTWDTLHSPTILPPHSQFSYWKDQASPGNVSSYSEILHSPTLYGNKSYASRPTLQTMMSAEDETKSPEPERRPKNQRFDNPTTSCHRTLTHPNSKKFKCDWPSCTSAFARKADRDRHKYCVHQKDQSEKKDCPEPNCLRKGDQGFTRSDHLTEHLRNFHHKELPRRSRRGRPASSSIEAAP